MIHHHQLQRRKRYLIKTTKNYSNQHQQKYQQHQWHQLDLRHLLRR